MVSKYSIVSRYKSLQKCVAEIFENVGYCVDHWPSNEELHFEFELTRDGIRYAFALKESRTIDVSDNGVMAAANDLLKSVIYPLAGRTPILVIVGIVSPEVRKQLAQYHKNLLIVDIRNLLFMVQGNEELRNRFVSQLLFSVDEIEAEAPDLGLDIDFSAPTDNVWDKYIMRLKGWNALQEDSAEYEEFCSELLQHLFADDLTRFEKQKNTNAGLFRIDMIAKIKWGNNKEFWEVAERYFQTKYIVFEYKNYSGEITQTQVYTTVKYLYAKALRSIAILISTNGADAHADVAIRGVLREEGKLIISLSNSDLIEMLEMKKRKEYPADYLSQKLDDLLISLEK